MDFTLSNKKQNDPKSLHYVNKDLSAFYHEQSRYIKQKLESKKLNTKLGVAAEDIGAEEMFNPDMMGGGVMQEIENLENPY